MNINLKEAIKERLLAVPQSPGVYIHRDKNGKVIYVGKSNSLRDRLRTYFIDYRNSNDPKMCALSEEIVDFEYILTDTEQEALLLENSLIKKYMPQYNARLKDSSTYPFIKVGLSDEFPRICVTRKVTNKKDKYFGPYASIYRMRKTLRLINRLFPYRSCTKKITGKDKRPCLDYYIKRCTAPCTGYISSKEYMNTIQQVIRFLNGDTASVVRELKNTMMNLSENLEFEKAAILRDRVDAIKSVSETQKVVGLTSGENIDAIEVVSRNNLSYVEIFFIRQGSLIGRDNFVMDGTRHMSKPAVVSAFVTQFYGVTAYVPSEILVPSELEEAEVINSWLNCKRGAKVKMLTPKRGVKRDLLKMVLKNAEDKSKQIELRRLTSADASAQVLNALQQDLNLPFTPKRIECYDISHIQGTNVVASMVVFENARPITSEYRLFKVKVKPDNDDITSMREIIYRRFHKLKQEIQQENLKRKPQLVLIDGGQGQLNVAHRTLIELDLIDIPIASIAKRNEEIYQIDTQDPLQLPKNSKSLMLLQRIRDEAHRFAITFHRNIRGKKSNKSLLDNIHGIGVKRKKALIQRFGSISEIRKAEITQIANVSGMNVTLALRIKESI